MRRSPTVEVDDPLALEPGEKIVALRSIRNDPLGRLHSHRQIDEAQYQGGRAFQNDWEKAERGPRAVDPTREYVDGGQSAGADHRGPAQGGAAAESGRARTRRGRLGAGARRSGPGHDHGAGRAAAGTAYPALERLFFAAIPRMPRPAGADVWICDSASDSRQEPSRADSCDRGMAARTYAGTALFQPGAAKAFQIMLAVGVELPGQLGRDPGQRNIGLRAAQLLERGLRDLDLAGHAGGDRQHAIGAGEIAALADRLARKRDRFVIVPPTNWA